MGPRRKKKVGLALSGGAARGLAHIGVLDVLQREGIPIDIIAGTSAGAIIGAVYACCRDSDIVKKHALSIDWKKMASLFDLSFRMSGLLKGGKIEKLLAEYIGGDIDFSKLKIPFSCVATDIDTGEEIVITTGSVTEALRASISVPGIFSVAKRGDRYLVDGGLTTPVPVDTVKQMGADFIIAVNVNPRVTDRISQSTEKRIKARKEPNIFHVMMQSIYITTYTVARNSLADADIVIEPDLKGIGAADFQKAGEMILMGQEAAADAIPGIKRKLKEI
ncbi:MAG: patatin-like phospholipase family protein [Dehalococcoidales bacterium]|nr:patatin-like phospholipase family protein [Dehalococcoidales bacterium]